VVRLVNFENYILLFLESSEQIWLQPAVLQLDRAARDRASR
jgi:hypothetical protein